MKVGLVPGSFKPMHAGHMGLIELAARECDIVHVYASTSDRDNVSGQAMLKVWKELIEPVLPDNVDVTYGGSPVANVYKELDRADKAQSTDEFSIYSDPTDVEKNYPDDRLAKVAPELMQLRAIVRRPVTRTSTVDVSGTKMREFLVSDDFKSFAKMTPKQVDAQKMWDILKSMPVAPPAPKKVTAKARTPKTKKDKTSEDLLRSYVRELLG